MVGCSSQPPEVAVGDPAAASEKALLAAGANRVLHPTAPIETAPRPVVDEDGQTNFVRTAEPIFTWYFELKDGRELTLLVQGDKVISIR